MRQTICALILTKNEEIHIGRVLKQLHDLLDHILIVDSGSTDRTVDICRHYSCEVIEKEWVNYATQFNYGLDKLAARFDWCLRIDADEYFDDIDGLAELLSDLRLGEHKDKSGLTVNRRMTFLGKDINHGGIFPIKIVRLFRLGEGRCETRWMDEHIIVSGNVAETSLTLVDDNKQGLDYWLNKHISYAKREAVDMLFIDEKIDQDETLLSSNKQTQHKRNIKEKYYSRLPIFWRALIYFIYRYFIRGGFRDGKIGLIYHFMHALWYRFLVDLYVWKVKQEIYVSEKDLRLVIEDELKIRV